MILLFSLFHLAVVSALPTAQFAHSRVGGRNADADQVAVQVEAIADYLRSASRGASRSDSKAPRRSLVLISDPEDDVLDKSDKRLEHSQAHRADAKELVDEAKAGMKIQDSHNSSKPEGSAAVDVHDSFFKEMATQSIHWPTYPLIAFCDGCLARFFRRYEDVSWFADYKLWVGIGLVAGIWVKRLATRNTKDEDKDEEVHFIFQAFFVFGWNLVILHMLQYASSGMVGIMRVCVVLTIQSLVQTYLSWKEEHVVEEEKFVADTLYLDLEAPGPQIISLVLAQVGAFWFYITSIQGNYNPNHLSYLFWLWAFITMQMVMIFNRGKDSVLGFLYPTAEWWSMVKDVGKITFQNQDEDSHHKPFKMQKGMLFVRGASGFVTNTILRDIMAFTIPLMLSDFGDPMNFLVYCVGVNFICSMDDMTEKVYAVKVDGQEVEAPSVS